MCKMINIKVLFSCESVKSLKFSYFLHSLLFTVTQERPKQAAVQMVQDGHQEVLIKLKGCGKLEGKRRIILNNEKKIYKTK